MNDYFINSLIVKKLRSILLLLSVLVCVFLITTVDGMLSQMRAGFLEELARYMGKISIQQKGSGYPPFDSNIPEDLYEELFKMDEIMEEIDFKESSPLVVGIIEPAENPMEFAKVFAIGILPGKESAYLVDTKVRKGERTLEGQSPNSVILGSTAYEVYNSPKIGAKLTLQNKEAIVSGVLEKTGQDNIDQGIFMSLEFAQNMYGKKNTITSILVTAKDAEKINELAGLLREKFPDYEIVTQEDIKDRIDKIMSMPNKFMGMISWMVFFVSIVVITNIMLISVNERKKEIGILRAIGFQRSQILWGIVSESLLLAMIGGSLGLLLSIPAAHVMDWTFIFSWKQTIKIFILTIIIGIFSGLYPAFQATRISPVEAIRYE